MVRELDRADPSAPDRAEAAALAAKTTEPLLLFAAGNVAFRMHSGPGVAVEETTWTRRPRRRQQDLRA
jgi:hypothetical protein